MPSVTTAAIVAALNGTRDAAKALKVMQPRILEWEKRYRNEPVELTLDLIDGTHKRTRRSMGMAQTVAQDWSSLIWTENTAVVAGDDDSPETVALSAVFDDARNAEIGDFIEASFASGTGIIDVLVDGLTVDEETGDITASDGAALDLDYTEASCVVPLAWVRGDMTSVALLSFDGDIIDARIHTDEGTQQRVVNRRFRIRGDGQRLDEEAVPEGVIAETIIVGAPRLFAAVKPAIANNFDRRSPFGVSVYGNAIPQLDFCDDAFDNAGEDIALSGKMVFVPETMLRRSDVVDPRTGKPKLIPPQKDKRNLFVALESGMGDDGKITEHNPDMRIGDNERAINVALSLLSVKCGFGTERYRYRGETVATATQIISENSDLYRNRAKHFRSVSAAIATIARAVLWLSANVLGESVDADAEITVRADDSVIEDDNARIDRGMRLVGGNLISTRTFLVDYMKYTPDEADEEIARIGGVAPLFEE